MQFPHPDISAYAENFTSPENDLLARINRETWSEVMLPRMLSGHAQGRFLSLISQLIKPKRILEIGTYTGYSALCLAEGLADKGLIYTIDNNAELESRVRNYFAESSYDSKIKFLIGDAMQIIPALTESWDLIFLDADKENYSAYFDMVIECMTPGALLIADNVLWSGRVLDEKNRSKDPETKALHQFNQKVQDDPRVNNVLLPLRDGLMMCRKTPV